MKKVSVVIPTYNRFKFLMNTIKSVKSQTYKKIEIIVVNDCSTQKEYYHYDWEKNGIKIIHLRKNSKKIFGFACPGGYQRNFGIRMATGKYIAICDDDDIWLPNKLELQIEAMKKTGCKFSSTNGLKGVGVYNPKKKYKEYLDLDYYQDTFKSKGREDILENGFPTVWKKELVRTHNCIICSSVVFEKKILKKSGYFMVGPIKDDFRLWRRILNFTDCAYVSEKCIYYDMGHGNGKNYFN